MELPARAQEIIEKFNLKSHPEGGFYVETYRSAEIIPGKDRQLLTSIYFLITGNSISFSPARPQYFTKRRTPGYGTWAGFY
jgi:predicted cupin superfamily sugar epimerase